MKALIPNEKCTLAAGIADGEFQDSLNGAVSCKFETGQLQVVDVRC